MSLPILLTELHLGCSASEDDISTFRFDLPRGANILLATATWIPEAEDEYVTGYVIYKFLTNVTKN